MWGQTGRWGTRAHSLQPTQEEERAVSFRGDGVKEGVEEERVRACMGVAWVRGVMWEGVKKGGRCWWWVQKGKTIPHRGFPCGHPPEY